MAEHLDLNPSHIFYKHSDIEAVLTPGVLPVLKALTVQRVNELKPHDHPEETWTLDRFLHKNKIEILRSLRKDGDLENVLYPYREDTDTNKWNISTYTLVLLKTCQLDDKLQKHIENLNKLSNKLSLCRDKEISKSIYHVYLHQIQCSVDTICEVLGNDGLTLKANFAENYVPSSVRRYPNGYFQKSNKDIQIVSHGDIDAISILEWIDECITKAGQNPLVPVIEVVIIFEHYNATDEKTVSEYITREFWRALKKYDAESSGLRDHSSQFLDEEDSYFRQSTKVRETIEFYVQTLFKGHQSITDVATGCVKLTIQCKTIQAVMVLLEQSINGFLTLMLEPLEDELRQIPDHELSDIYVGVTKDSCWNLVNELKAVAFRGHRIQHCHESMTIDQQKIEEGQKMIIKSRPTTVTSVQELCRIVASEERVKTCRDLTEFFTRQLPSKEGKIIIFVKDETDDEATAAISSLDIDDESESDEGPRGEEAQSNDAVGGRKRTYALDDYDAQYDDEISVCKGDGVMLLDQEYTDNEDWCYARHDPIFQNIKEEGYIPRRYVAMEVQTECEYDDYELGSDILEDLGDISDDEVEYYKRIIKETGYTALRKQLEETINRWKDIQIHIAVTGESGTGKSSFINSIRGLKADDPDAADVDAVETTLKATRYTHPHNPNLQVWDLPGVGTSTFTRENYLQQVDLGQFDFVLLLSSSRFKENDIWLAKEILQLKPNFNLFFVRTKIDDDLRSAERARHKPQTDDDRQALLQKVRKNVTLNLKKGGIIRAEIYLVDNYDIDAFDFGTIFSKLIQKVSSMKREAMIMSLSDVRNEVVQKKLAVLKSRIKIVSKSAAVAAVFANTGTNKYPAEIDVLLEECRFYRLQLGLNLESLQIIAKRLEIELEELLVKLSMQSYLYVDFEDRFVKYYEQFEKVEPKIWHSLPIIGNKGKVKAHQKQCAFLLKEFLDMCSNETHRIQMHMAIVLEGI